MTTGGLTVKGCEERERDLWLRALGERDETPGAALDLHLRQCGACRRALRRRQAWLAAVREKGRARLSPEDGARLRVEVLDRAYGETGPWGGPWKGAFFRGASWASAAALTGLLLWLFLPGLLRGPGPSIFREPLKMSAEGPRSVKDEEVIENIDFLREMDTVERLIRVVDRRELGRWKKGVALYAREREGHEKSKA